jgi:hypothetical protein
VLELSLTWSVVAHSYITCPFDHFLSLPTLSSFLVQQDVVGLSCTSLAGPGNWPFLQETLVPLGSGRIRNKYLGTEYAQGYSNTAATISKSFKLS